jgi:glycine cleavage system H protein
MESLLSAFESLGILLAGLLVRAGLLFTVLLVLAVPVLLLLSGVRAYGFLRRRAMGVARVDGLFWRQDLLYGDGHTWLKTEDGGKVRVGLDDLAQRLFPGPCCVRLPEAGSRVHEGDMVAEIGCGDKRTRIPSPVSGTVVAVNDALRRDPSLLHRDPYADGWMFAVDAEGAPEAPLRSGFSAREWLQNESVRLSRFLEQELGTAAADGGELLMPAPALLRTEQWDALTRSFLHSAGERRPLRGPATTH